MNFAMNVFGIVQVVFDVAQERLFHFGNDPFTKKRVISYRAGEIVSLTFVDGSGFTAVGKIFDRVENRV